MEASLESVKITLGFKEAKQLKNELDSFFNSLTRYEEQLGGDGLDTLLREEFPKINELLGVLNIRISDGLPF